jgi:hypothetical protein
MQRFTQSKKWNAALLIPLLSISLCTIDLSAQTNVEPKVSGNTTHSNSSIKEMEDRINQLSNEVANIRNTQPLQYDKPSIEADLSHESPEELENGHGRRGTSLSSGSDNQSYPKPKVSVHGTIRVDVATMDRVPQYGNVVQPYTVQIPLNFQKERRHHQTIIDARLSTFYIDAYHNICGTKVYGMIEVGFDTSSFGVNPITREYNAGLNQAYLRADFPQDWYFEAGLTYDLVTVTNIAYPLFLPICEGRTPAGMTIGTTPLLKVGGSYQLCDCYGEIDYFVGVQQQNVWTGNYFNPQIALSPIRGEPFFYPLLGAGVSWENWEPLQMDVRFAVCQNRFAIGGTRRTTNSAAWLGKVSVQSQIFGPTVYAAYSYMDGMSRFAELSFPDSVLQGSDLDIENVRGHGAFAGAWFDVGCDVKCNAMVGWAWAKPISESNFSGQITNQYRTAQVCFWREFWGSYAAAVEYKRWDIKACNGDKGQLNLFMGTLFYFF